MQDMLAYAVIGLLLVNSILLMVLLGTGSGSKLLRMETRQDAWHKEIEKNLERIERALKEEMLQNREEFNAVSRHGRTEISQSIMDFNTMIANQMSLLTQTNEQKLEKLREAMEVRLKALQDENNSKLEQMRATVDEKLHATLEQRLGESFKLVSERLEMVHRGLGEMQSLASGVGDLKRVLTNVKVRGTWGEIQLGSILEQILTQEQYARNVATKKNSAERVEFAIRLPGRDEKNGDMVWLPIDSKFPQEDYQRLLEAQEQANPVLAEEASKALEARVKVFAKDIKQKYIDPPGTTDFGIMFLPTEGLYAEILRRPGLCECLQRDYRIVAAGPTTLIALLNSLQMGFRTLAIERRSSEVWALLGAVKTEFNRFGEVLEKTQKKLQEASDTIETAAKKSRSIGRKLKNVQELPLHEAAGLLEDGEEPESAQIAITKDEA